MLLPFWLALSASLVLHAGVLLAPGWDLPLDVGPETAPIEARLVAAQPAAAKAPVPAAARPVRKRAPPQPLLPPIPTPPLASAPIEPVAAVPDAPEPSVPAAEPMSAEPIPTETESAEAEPPAVLPAPTFAARWPRSGRILYQVTRGEGGLFIGQSDQRWTHDGQNYHLHAQTETTGLAALFHPVRVVQDSRGVFDTAGLRPLEFEVQRTGKGRDSVRFDPEQGRIVLARGQSVPFVVAAQDLLSLFYQLAALSFDVPEFPIAVTNGRSLTNHVIVVGAELVIETPLGTRQVRHLRVSSKTSEDTTDIWLDTESRLPLKIRYRDRKGEIFDQIAIAIETAHATEAHP